MARKVARLLFTQEFLIEALGLPDDTLIGSAEYDFARGLLTLVVSQKSIPPVPEAPDGSLAIVRPVAVGGTHYFKAIVSDEAQSEIKAAAIEYPRGPNLIKLGNNE